LRSKSIGLGDASPSRLLPIGPHDRNRACLATVLFENGDCDDNDCAASAG
jgi:hypothetical protein